jgi:hypothetical protein
MIVQEENKIASQLFYFKTKFVNFDQRTIFVFAKLSTLAIIVAVIYFSFAQKFFRS